MAITNNDSPACQPATFDLTVADSDRGRRFVVPSALSQNSVTLTPGAQTSLLLTVTGQPGETGGTNDTSVTATDPAGNHAPVTSNEVTTTIDVPK